MTKDEKIYDVAVAMIRRSSMDSTEWKCTCIGVLHSALVREFSTLSGELILASSFAAIDSWYVFTTRRVVCRFKGQTKEEDPAELVDSRFGNFKGYGAKQSRLAEIPTEEAVLKFSNGAEVHFEYETGKASMAPIHAVKYWRQKHPILHKLMTSAERRQLRSR